MPISSFNNKTPRIHSTTFVVQSATIVGDVIIGGGSSVWPNAVIRGDNNAVRIGNNVNVQDNVVIDSKTKGCVTIGNNVSVGHGAILHGCTIGSNILIGMGSIIMENAVIDDWVLIGAGSIITENTMIPTNSLVYGIPGRVVNELKEDKKKYILANVREYFELAQRYKIMKILV